MSNTAQRFTVIVPTRERSDTLGYCLKTLLTQEYENLTILVSDNFSQDQTRDVVASFGDKRLRYINTGKRISMSHNWEFALNHVDGGWVTFLGDDDGLLPGAITLLNDILQEFPCEAANSLRCTYFWPNNGSSNGASLAVPTRREGIQYLDSKAELTGVMTGQSSYTRLPCIYQTGFATVSAINRARDASGRFFRSRIPDAYSGVALSSVCENFLRIGIPLAVVGASVHSQGGSIRRLDQDAEWRKFLSEENIPFHPTLIYGNAFRLLIYECYLQSEFLHGDFLALKLKDQLELAIADNGVISRNEIREQCRQIAALNGVELSETSFSSFIRLIRVSVIRLARRFAGVPGRALILGADVAGQNVYEASLKASEVISIAKSRNALSNSLQNVAAELGPRSVARRLNLVRYV